MQVTDGQLIVTIDGAWQMTNVPPASAAKCDEISVTWIQKFVRNGARNGAQQNIIHWTRRLMAPTTDTISGSVCNLKTAFIRWDRYDVRRFIVVAWGRQTYSPRPKLVRLPNSHCGAFAGCMIGYADMVTFVTFHLLTVQFVLRCACNIATKL